MCIRDRSRSDFTPARIRALAVLADVLRVRDEPQEARKVLEDAIALAQQKGSIAHERILRATLDGLAAQPPATA